MKKTITEKLAALLKLIRENKIPSAVIAAVLVLTITVSAIALYPRSEEKDIPVVPSSEPQNASSDTESEVESASSENSSEASSEETSSETPVSSAESTVSSKPKNTVTTPSVSSAAQTPSPNGSYKYNTNTDIEDNVFLDALVYTGYNLNKHRSDGLMWVYILASQKRAKGWLSNIGYGGGCSGYETANGKPDIKRFERGGLVCASYVTYVYFNYLPNVAGIDTSMLDRPVRSTSANDWYNAAKKWVEKGYSKSIGFNASKISGTNYIKFTPNESIPIGSIMIYNDYYKRGDFGTHVAVYAGYKNNYHWIYHVGNSNGPEFCAVERIACGPDPQWPLAVITTPSNIRMSAMLEVKLTDDSGTAVSGVEFTLKTSKGGTLNLGKTNASGIVSKEGLAYGSSTLTFTVPSGYTCDSAVTNVNLTTANNSKNTVNIKLTKKIAEPSVTEAPDASDTYVSQADGSQQ